MPLRNVATNYTFEQQRQEINLLAADVDALDTNKTTTARSAISVTDAGGEGSLAYDSGTGVITYTGPAALPQSLGTGDSPTFTNLTVSGYLAGPETLTIDPAAVGDNTGTVVIAGNLQVDGTTTTINSTTMTVDDLNITLASGAANAAAADTAGLSVDGASATLYYRSTPDAWASNKKLLINQTSSQATSAKLEVTSTKNSSFPQYSYGIMATDDAAYNVTPGSGYGFGYKWNAAGNYVQAGGIRMIKENTTDNDYAGAMLFYTRPMGDGPIERLRITSGGNTILKSSTNNQQPRLQIESYGEYGEIKSDGNGSLIFDADPDFNAANTVIKFAVDGSEKVRIQNTGGVTFFGGPLEEKVDKRSGDISDGGNIDVMNGNITRYTGTGTAGAQTINIRGNGSNTYNSITSIDYAVSLTIIHRPNGNEYINGIAIDGTLINDVQWAGGSAPTSATTSGLQALHLTIWKVAANSYSVMAILNEFG